MLRLASTTPRSWAEGACEALEELLIDHAHCEKKAASTAINLLFRYPDRPELVATMSPLAREELQHFEQVLQLLSDRGFAYRKLTTSPYAAALHRAIRRDEPERLLDTLLVCALIEARSCERMKLLSEVLPDRTLSEFYSDLLASEARHHRLFVQLARTWFPDDEVRHRLSELAEFEAGCLTGRGPVRVHS